LNRKIILTTDENGWIVAKCPELPGCVSQGKTEAEASANIREAIKAWLWVESLKSSNSQMKSLA
jgi:predicted RNase H-like HicB family nuclease